MHTTNQKQEFFYRCDYLSYRSKEHVAEESSYLPRWDALVHYRLALLLGRAKTTQEYVVDKIFKLVWFFFPFDSDYDHNYQYETMENTNQTGFKMFIYLSVTKDKFKPEQTQHSEPGRHSN